MPPPTAFVDVYLRARGCEHRLLADDVVRHLPIVPADDARRHEWRQRADSSRRFVRYVSRCARHRDSLTVWELGCGNGWLSALVASLDGVTVVGSDVNDEELDQARRVFADLPRLQFQRRDALATSALLAGADERPDLIVLASTLQYVTNAGAFLTELAAAAPSGTEIHVFDTPFYDTADLDAARDRTRQHYEALGVPGMIEHYNHHPWDVFAGLRHDVLYRPDATRPRIERRLLHMPRSTFPWIRVTAGGAR